jgi:predicted membrane-bound spermidine synthase
MRVTAMRSRAILAFVLLLFFVSGLAALLYQTIWQRMLGFFSGVDVYSVTITVAAFMAGLGCGSLAGGYLADRLSNKNLLFVFGAAEAIVALFALCSKWLYYDLLYIRWNSLADSRSLLPIVLFASLLLPTFCMGITLPILAKKFTEKIETASAIVGCLYGVNALGAAFGALATPWILLQHFSFPDILRIGASLNAICAVGALLTWWLAADRPATTVQVSTPSEAARPLEVLFFPTSVWMLIYALSGFLALSLEIVWFRLLGVAQKSTSFTFPTLLAVYLAGLGLGAITSAPLAKRVRRPAAIFLAVQSTVTLYAAVAFTLFLQQVDHQPFFQPLWTYLGGYNPINAAGLLVTIPAWFSSARFTPDVWQSEQLTLLLYFILPFVLIAPSTFLMGVSFPILQKLIHDNAALLGRRVGWLQTWNIVGSMLGALLAGWVLLRWLGSSGTLKLLVVLGGTFLFLLAWHIARRPAVRLVCIIAAISLVSWIAAALPSSNELWAKLHGTQPQEIIAREGESGLSVLKGKPSAFEQNGIGVFSNGLGQSWLPYGRVHTEIGLLAALLHPNPEDVAIIGLGSGDTLYASGGNPRTRQLTCIEIVEPIYGTLKEVAPRIRYPALLGLLQDSRIQWLFTDGRAYIQRSGKKFDVIEADALRPGSAYSGNLYSCEYFRTVKAHLKPRGLAVTWTPTNRVLSSFIAIFPHAIAVDEVAIGGDQAVDIDVEEILRRLADPFTSEYYKRIGTDVRPLITNLLAGKFTRFSPDIARPEKTDLNSDLFPRDEYMVPPQP